MIKFFLNNYVYYNEKAQIYWYEPQILDILLDCFI